MAGNLEFYENLTDAVWGDSALQTLFYLSCIIIVILENEKWKKISFVGYTMLILLGIYNPITTFLCEKIFVILLTAYSCRLFLLMPIGFIIAYAMTLLVMRIQKLKRLVVFLGIVVILVLAGHSVYSESWMVKAENVNKVPNDVLMVCNMVSEEEKEVRIMVPSAIVSYIRQIDASIKMPYGRGQENEEIVKQVGSEDPDLDIILEYGKNNDCDYVVCKNNDVIINKFYTYGYEIYGYTNNYIIIRLK